MKKAIICLLAFCALGACGVKPGNVKPPEDATTIYPRVYPDPAHDGDALPQTIRNPVRAAE